MSNDKKITGLEVTAEHVQLSTALKKAWQTTLEICANSHSLKIETMFNFFGT